MTSTGIWTSCTSTATTSSASGAGKGDWSGRWSDGSGRAKIRTTRDRIFILYTDVNDGTDGASWLLELIRFGKDEVRGRWAQLGDADSTGVFYGRIVDEERIDGIWGEDARWDFRRKLKKK